MSTFAFCTVSPSCQRTFAAFAKSASKCTFQQPSLLGLSRLLPHSFREAGAKIERAFLPCNPLSKISWRIGQDLQEKSFDRRTCRAHITHRSADIEERVSAFLAICRKEIFFFTRRRRVGTMCPARFTPSRPRFVHPSLCPSPPLAGPEKPTRATPRCGAALVRFIFCRKAGHQMVMMSASLALSSSSTFFTYSLVSSCTCSSIRLPRSSG